MGYGRFKNKKFLVSHAMSVIASAPSLLSLPRRGPGPIFEIGRMGISIAAVSLFGNKLYASFPRGAWFSLRPQTQALAGAAKGGERVLEVVRQELHLQEVFPGRALGLLLRLRHPDFPLFRRQVAPPDPG